jgi:hypothetical protein
VVAGQANRRLPLADGVGRPMLLGDAMDAIRVISLANTVNDPLHGTSEAWVRSIGPLTDRSRMESWTRGASGSGARWRDCRGLVELM